jgi:hypothetical protein
MGPLIRRVHQTTNLGVRSSNLFERVKEILIRILMRSMNYKDPALGVAQPCTGLSQQPVSK